LPIYEYTCQACDHHFEKIQKMSDASVRKCPACGKLKAKRLISRSAFVLKGDGWYVTDYPSKDRKAAMKAESDNGGSAKTSDKTSDVSSKGEETSKSKETFKSKETSKGKDSPSGKESSKSKTKPKANTE
jgi:putative FmdB family regulatory protein